MESNSEQEQDTSRDPDVMIEYTQAGQQYSQSQEVPIFSSITNFKSLPRHLLLQNVGDYPSVRGLQGGHQGLHSGRGTPYANNSAILLTEPISPPKQFDSGLRVQPHSQGVLQGGRDDTY